MPATPALVHRLGLEGELQPANENAARRFLYRAGRLHQLPGGPLTFLTCPVLSVRGRLRVLLEPFARPRPEDEDETIYGFVRRRIGDEAARVLIDAMVSGVFAVWLAGSSYYGVSMNACIEKAAEQAGEIVGYLAAGG